MNALRLIIIGLLLCTAQSYAQNVDLIIKEKCYRSYYSYEVKAPLFVVYKLYKGGGDESRKGMSFKGKYPHFKYAHSGYDKGHMANAEDFAYDKILLENTFRYHNALPQTPKQNRGIWKVWEEKIRKDSQTDSLLIICGGKDFDKYVPKELFKVVYSLTDKHLKYSVGFIDDSVFVIKPKDVNIDFHKFYYK